MPPRCCALGGRLRGLRGPRRAGGWERGREGPVLRAPGCRAGQELEGVETVTIRRPDDWHLHVRDGGGLKAVVPLSALHFGRAIIMPNLVPPVTTAELAVAYRDRVRPGRRVSVAQPTPSVGFRVHHPPPTPRG